MKVNSLVLKPNFVCSLAIAALALLTAGCSTIHSNLTIEPGQQFVLGGGSRGAFVVDAVNVGPVSVSVAQRLSSGQVVSLGKLSPGQSDQLRFPAGAAALLENHDAQAAKLSLKIRGDTDLGMRYESTP